MNKITNTQIEQIDTICDIQLHILERLKGIIREGWNEHIFETMVCNIEIIQEIIKKVKNHD